MGFDRPASHLKLARDLGIVAALQKQFDNLLFAWPQPDRLILHCIPPLSESDSAFRHRP